MRSFVDTNILLYSDDAADPRKQKLATELLVRLRRGRHGVLSTQVLQEYYANAISKLRLDPMLARRRVELFGRFELVLPSLELLLAAIDLKRLHNISIWDALIVQAAISAGCAVLYTEDLQHDQRIAGVRINNPFRQPPGTTPP